MTMTAEQLEELLNDINEVGREYWHIASDELASLTRYHAITH